MRPNQANRPRRHHYLPKSYLAGFTDTSTVTGRLHVLSLQDGRQWQGTPENVGHQRDFYRLDGIEGMDPFELEEVFGEIEAGAAAAIRRADQSGRLPDDPEQFSYLINFVALMAARVPQTRENVARPLRRTAEMLLQIELSSRERYEALIQEARRSGHDIPDVDYERVRRAVADNRVTVEVSQAQHLDTLLHMAELLAPLLAERHWTILRSGDGNEFVVSDFPVSINWSIPRPPSFYTPGFGVPGTDVTFPLTKRTALLGRLEPGDNPIELDRLRVASFNSRTLMYAGRIACSSNGEFLWETPNDGVAGTAELIRHIQAHPRRDDE